MVKPKLIVITDWSIAGIEEKLSALRPLGDRVAIQHRAPGMATRELVEKGRWLASLGLPLFVNGRLDVAMLLGAHLHLPEDGPTAAECRPFIGARWMSVALHAEPTDRPPSTSLRMNGADFGLLSPVFAPGSKPDDSRPTLGPDGFARLAASLPLPVYALGGISPDNIGLVPNASGAAVISSVLKAKDPLAAATAMLDALELRP